ncbi:MAG TPA: pantetheine-phosphate adenylyltransferase [Methylococcaceae bacterium]|nr:pantetheine-phosphate adenylyltransferase [Methylococcaceae bacterium]HIN69184.1 pantetheine-phosphate adenylyltransferase [Methylococcales bacterium]HIA46287.1 pantetheine-phosphate adenylyltransferase [Methylococcaceae bacterium]HIB61882.1 pantetheine-phosphate adenylyltransferase [Methylococcaceae bacterium]HIO13420.1 pantetheine-phosphate adenylyltransferase [Methylococcales bacterium]
MMVSAIYPGTFDPVTNGHLDLIVRASSLFERVVVAVAFNQAKKPLFTIDERVALMEETVCHLPRVDVIRFDSLLVTCALEQQVSVILRGLRAVSDFEYEFQLAGMNRHLASELETIFLTPAEKYGFLSSSLIKESSALGGDISKFVPRHVQKALVEKLRKGK